ncbi:uncharacterized protein CMU_002190 [Cryptosporidium muris RN66]|uniref:Uncharacterized protein n=1 Tax=Cryptosporidium muris (strain RN66) TaxID=441375 RepID=B6AGK7_CRYMR|nr:uncharacterized protein CMU_002190 [Cryptosporidium muris RN66]EEA07348.1 hypothetical protein, conserved [Cryptosporidium muris RN66]|eukprot:XP_002141697.1 hypothetical protein [Cryptosporidium muris RN66]
MNNIDTEPNNWLSLQERALKLSGEAFNNLQIEYNDKLKHLKFEIEIKNNKINELTNKLELNNRLIESLYHEKSDLIFLLKNLQNKCKKQGLNILNTHNELKSIREDYCKLKNRLELCEINCSSSSNYELINSNNIIDIPYTNNNIIVDSSYNIINGLPNQETNKTPSLIEQNENIEFSENQKVDNNFNINDLSSNLLSHKIESNHLNYSNHEINSVSKDIYKDKIWYKISQVLPTNSYLSLVTFVRKYHLNEITEEELQTEIQNILLYNNKAIQDAFAKDILQFSLC